MISASASVALSLPFNTSTSTTLTNLTMDGKTTTTTIKTARFSHKTVSTFNKKQNREGRYTAGHEAVSSDFPRQQNTSPYLIDPANGDIFLQFCLDQFGRHNLFLNRPSPTPPTPPPHPFFADLEHYCKSKCQHVYLTILIKLSVAPTRLSMQALLTLLI